METYGEILGEDFLSSASFANEMCLDLPERQRFQMQSLEIEESGYVKKKCSSPAGL